MSQEYTEHTEQAKNAEQTSKYSAYFMMILVIFLCLVALTGATFALFTSNPDDGTIGVVTTTGNVKVDLVSAGKVETSLIGGVLEFEHDDAEDGIYFEPGATFYTKAFRVKNIGDVSLNFRMYISNDNRMNMEEFESAFEFYITDDPKNPENGVQLKSFIGHLEAGDYSDSFYLVIKMKETVGNEFQAHEYSGIGITVYAVQGNVNIKE